MNWEGALPDDQLDWPTRIYVERVAKEKADEVEKRIRALFGVTSDEAMETLREDIRYTRRQRKAAEDRAQQANRGFVDGAMKMLWGFLTAAALGAVTWFMNGGQRP